MARRMACDSRLQVVLHGDDGSALGIGHTSREVPQWLKRVVMDRDGGCTFPGCGTRRLVDAHHVIPWPMGPTDLDNLMIACRTHHKLVHEGGWNVKLDERYVAQWYRPDGRVYDPGPRSPSETRSPEITEELEPAPPAKRQLDPWPRLELAGFA